MTTAINIEFRPRTYFRPQKLEQYLLSKVKGAVLKKKIQALFDEGRHSEVSDLLGADGISTHDRKALEAFHPMLLPLLRSEGVKVSLSTHPIVVSRANL